MKVYDESKFTRLNCTWKDRIQFQFNQTWFWDMHIKRKWHKETTQHRTKQKGKRRKLYRGGKHHILFFFSNYSWKCMMPMSSLNSKKIAHNSSWTKLGSAICIQANSPAHQKNKKKEYKIRNANTLCASTH